MIVNPRNDCCHYDKEALYPIEKMKDIKFSKLKCEECEETNELWICLTCSFTYCGRYVRSHFTEHHAKNPTHSVCISLLDLSIWCYECITPGFIDAGSYVESPIIAPYVEILADWKFGTDCPRSLDVLNSMTNEEVFNIKYRNFIELLKNKQFKKIVFMTGAGISTSAGIPDFRSKTGLFAQLMAKYGLQKPEEFFLKETFVKQPHLLYDFIRNADFFNKYKPTITHFFMRYLIEMGIDCHIFTQNIDDLEQKAGIPKEKIVFAHGTIREANCVQCNKKIPIEEVNDCLEKNAIKQCPDCNGFCKPNIILYGENLPKEFYEKTKVLEECDLGILIGTSLKVEPFSCLPHLLSKNCWKVAINRSKVGNFNYDDITTYEMFIQGLSDDIIIAILKDCSWWEDFNKKFNY